VQNTISLLSPFAAYLLAEGLPTYLWEQLQLPGELHLSGVLSVVAMELYVGRRGPYFISPETRLQGYAFWELVTFFLNGLIFGLIGLQLDGIVEALSESDYTVGELVLYAGLVSLTVILVRFFVGLPCDLRPPMGEPFPART
jgi:monovalent cation/hydrogen antiporter